MIAAALRRSALAAALLGASAVSAGAQVAPYHTWRTLESPHFRVHARAGLEREARAAAAAAEVAYAALSRELTAPRGPIDLVVTDDADYSNGFASVYPSNRIVVFTTPPVENDGLRFTEDWLALVVTHELAHVFHLDRVRGPWALAQRVFGRYPALFPNIYAPSWLTEGIAVYYESRLTAGGRLRDFSHRTIARASARDGAFPRIDQLGQGSPRFPGGARAYIYGSLFMEYLGATRGDSAIPRLIEVQSGALIPYRLNHVASRALGISLSNAYAGFSDSVVGSATLAGAALPGARELTTHALYALRPRWLSDSSLVYVGTDGRETAAAYSLGTNGHRERIGRRNGVGVNVPVADGGLLFAQLDYTSPQEVRSDLYLERHGRQRRLTHGARLIQPDARADGHITAIQLRATQTDLVLLSPDARQLRVLRFAAAGESWSQPRWSPDGLSIAAIRHRLGGEFSLEVIDVATGIQRALDRGLYTLESPSWSRDGAEVLYTSQEAGAPTLARVRADGTARSAAPRLLGMGTGIYSPELSPKGDSLAVVTLRADGYRIALSSVIAAELVAALPHSLVRPTHVDVQPLAPGAFRRYSAWRSLVPRYWLPVIETAPSRGARLGASTSGGDVLARHLYNAYLATTTSGFYPTGALSYRYAGLRAPFIDFRVAQDYNADGTLLSGGTTGTVGTLLRRAQDASVGLTFVRPRSRTFSALSAGVGAERRSFETDPVAFLVQLDTSLARDYVFPRAFLGAQWSNTQRPRFAISAEDGVSLAITARERWRGDIRRASASASVVGTAALFKSLDLPGFAHHVLALRLAGGIADRRAATALEVGGISGSTIEILAGYTVGEGRRTFGVRGFPTASVYGTRAAAAALEYRAPLLLSGRGLGLLPLFFDRSSVSLFADAGVASCATSPRNPSTCAPMPRIGRTIGSVGGELALSLAVLSWDSPQQIRIGFAAPVVGRELVRARAVSGYVAFGPSF